VIDAGGGSDAHSALAKQFCADRMRETVALARQIVGGNGILMSNGIARYFNDAEALYSYEGTREMNTLIVGKAVTGHSAFVR
jgi:glutaryl-CoA dehydrogenase